MDKLNDRNVIEFREELIKICEKYKCEISSSYTDSGNISLETNYSGEWSSYELEDCNSNYQVVGFDEEDTHYYPIDNYLKNMFNSFCNAPSYNLNKIGVITQSRNKAMNKLKEIYIDEYEDVNNFVCNRWEVSLTMNDGRLYRWVDPYLDTARGHKFSSLIIDRNLKIDRLLESLAGSTSYMGKDSVEIF